MPVLHPAGTVADQEYALILITVGLGVIVVIPVFIMLFTIAWKYRASNKKAKYEPEFSNHRGFEALWWGIPCLIILILAMITVVATHALDPFKPLASNVKPVKIQVIAMEWKWLFIYPDEGVATVNYVNIPEKTPIDFEITADAPMNSFWVPALAGQIYAMSGMSTQLHVMADSTGTYNGSSANISGAGFADMHFKVNSLSQSDFATWRNTSIYSFNQLTSDSYAKLAMPTRNNPETTYALIDSGLYNEVINKYMVPEGSKAQDGSASQNSSDMSGMKM